MRQLLSVQPLYKMNSRLLLLGILLAPLAPCETLTLTFSGVGSGSLGSDAFTGSAFAFTFSSDTSSLTTPPCCSNDISTPAGTPATFTIDSLNKSGSLTGDQAVFVNDKENDVGIWYYVPPDFITLGNYSFGTYKLSSDIGPISGTPSALSETFPTSLNGELLSLTSVSTLNFTANIGSGSSGGGGVGNVPEPSTLTMAGLALGCLFLAKWRRKTAADHS